MSAASGSVWTRIGTSLIFFTTGAAGADAGAATAIAWSEREPCASPKPAGMTPLRAATHTAATPASAITPQNEPRRQMGRDRFGTGAAESSTVATMNWPVGRGRDTATGGTVADRALLSDTAD